MYLEQVNQKKLLQSILSIQLLLLAFSENQQFTSKAVKPVLSKSGFKTIICRTKISRNTNEQNFIHLRNRKQEQVNNAVISAVNMSTWLKLDVPSYQSCKNNYTIFGQHTVWSIYLGDVPFRSTGISGTIFCTYYELPKYRRRLLSFKSY